jgi:hypothetical protein
MQMWGGEPVELLDPSRFVAMYRPEWIFGPPRPDPPPYGVEVSLPPEFNGQAFSLLRNGQVVGKGIAAGGKAQIPAAFDSRDPAGEQLQVAFEGDGAVPITIPVQGEPPAQVSIECPATPAVNNGDATIRGTVKPAAAGAEVELTYTDPRSRTFKRSAKTNARGEWSDTLSVGEANDPNGGVDGGTWQVSARYAGASPQSCSFEEADG